MTVGELIQILQKMRPDMEVILQKDSEGNDYSPLCATEVGIYVPQNTWSGTVYDTTWTWEEADFESHEKWMDFKSSHKWCCVLVPVN